MDIDWFCELGIQDDGLECLLGFLVLHFHIARRYMELGDKN